MSVVPAWWVEHSGNTCADVRSASGPSVQSNVVAVTHAGFQGVRFKLVTASYVDHARLMSLFLSKATIRQSLPIYLQRAEYMSRSFSYLCNMYDITHDMHAYSDKHVQHIRLICQCRTG